MSTTKLTKSQIKDLISTYQDEVSKLNFQLQTTRGTIKELKASYKTAKDDLAPAAKKPATRKTTARKTPAKKATPKKATPKKAVAKKAVAKKATTKKVAKPTKPAAKKVTKKAKPATKKAVAKKATARKPVAKKPAAKKPAVKKTDGRKGKAGRKSINTPYDVFVMDSITGAKKGINSAQLFDAVKAKAKAAKVYKKDAETKMMINRSLQKLVNRKKEVTKFPYSGRGNLYGLPEWGSRGRLKPEFKG